MAELVTPTGHKGNGGRIEIVERHTIALCPRCNKGVWQIKLTALGQANIEGFRCIGCGFIIYLQIQITGLAGK